jgi:N-acetylmuramoyl-L-alanine amidase
MSNYTSAYVIQSANLAVKIQDEYAKKAGRIDKGVHRQSIWVLWRTSMPSILTEIGYLTNPLEEGFLGSEKGQEYLAKALFRGIRKYKDEVEGKKREYKDEFENQEPLENENLKAGNLPLTKKSIDEDDSTKTAEEPAATSDEKGEPLAVAAKTVAIKEPEEKIPPPKESVKENKFTYLGTKKNDSSAVNKESADTIVSARLIAEKFKRESAESDKDQGEQETKKSPVIVRKDEIFFKVQFASSDVSINLKQEKYAGIIDADFYKMGNVLKYTSGKFVALKDAVAHQAELRQKGLNDCFVVAFVNGKRIDMAEARKLLEQSK